MERSVKIEDNQQPLLIELLNPRKPIESELIDSVTCPLCLCIVTDPRECSNCEKLYCHQHVQEWIKTKRTCPTCRARPWKLKPQCHRVYMRLLESLEFLCACGQVKLYKEAKTHRFSDHAKEEELNRKKIEVDKEQQRLKQEFEKKATLQLPSARVEEGPNMSQAHQALRQTMIRSKLMVIFNHKEDDKQEEEKHEEVIPEAEKQPQTIPLDPAKSYYFYFFPKQGQTVFLSRHCNAQINKNLRHRLLCFDLLIDNKHVLFFELVSMRVTDAIRNVTFQLHAEEIKGAVWRYFHNNREFVYPPNINAEIEAAYQQYREKGAPEVFVINFENAQCEVNLKKKEHVNLDTGAKRLIKRRET